MTAGYYVPDYVPILYPRPGDDRSPRKPSPIHNAIFYNKSLGDVLAMAILNTVVGGAALISALCLKVVHFEEWLP